MLRPHKPGSLADQTRKRLVALLFTPKAEPARKDRLRPRLRKRLATIPTTDSQPRR